MRTFTLLFFVFFGVCTAHASYPSLCERSPFGAKSVEVAEERPNGGDDFEFHGVCSIGGECMFSLFNKTCNKRYWLKLGEKSGGIVVKKYDRERRSVELVLADGTVGNIKMSEGNPRTKFGVTAGNSIQSMRVGTVPDDVRRKFLEAVMDGDR